MLNSSFGLIWYVFQHNVTHEFLPSRPEPPDGLVFIQSPFVGHTMPNLALGLLLTQCSLAPHLVPESVRKVIQRYPTPFHAPMSVVHSHCAPTNAVHVFALCRSSVVL